MAKRKHFLEEKPELLAEWDYDKNIGLRPEDYTGASDQRAWWKCKLGHSWYTAIKCRIIGTNCPFCAGKKAWPGFNDLATINPALVEEWDYEANNGLRPEDFTFASDKKVWWKCKLGHSWSARVANRHKGQRCPVCVGVKVLAGFNDLVTTHPKIAKEWDNEKNKLLRPEQFGIGSNKKVWWKCKRGHSWEATINSRKKSGCRFCYGKNVFNPGFNDLLTVNPILAAEWDYDKNGEMRPEDVAANTTKKAWWRCEKGHSWKAAVSNRNNGNGCPVCANKLLLKGYNDLMTIDPELCKEWDYEKNALLMPDAIIMNSPKPVWWKCSNHDHSWQASVLSRRLGSSCLYCCGKAVLVGFNDLKTLCPEIAAEWDYEKNGTLHPEQVTVQATAKVWWKCKEGHSYISRVYHRYNGNNCPYCAGNLPIVGENDLATLFPHLLDEWDYERNKKNPQEYTCGSSRKVYWKCKLGHRWLAPIVARTSGGTNCPRCKGKVQMKRRLVH